MLKSERTPLRGGKQRAAIGGALRLAVTGLVFAYLLARVDTRAVVASMARIAHGAWIAAPVAWLLAVAACVVRWRALMRAYDATALPSWPETTRLYFVGMFYNLLPGAVGGDLVRGYQTRSYFRDGAVHSLSVVFVERILGFAGLLVMTGMASLWIEDDSTNVLLYSALGLSLAALALAVLTAGRFLARFMPRRLANVARSLPAIARVGSFVWASALSVLCHFLVALSGHALILSLAPTVTLAQSLTIFSLGTLAGYFPLTVAGAGTRDTALVVLFARIGVPEPDALATSLLLLVLNVAVSSVGALLQSGRLSSDAIPPEPSTRTATP